MRKCFDPCEQFGLAFVCSPLGHPNNSLGVKCQRSFVMKCETSSSRNTSAVAKYQRRSPFQHDISSLPNPKELLSQLERLQAFSSHDIMLKRVPPYKELHALVGTLARQPGCAIHAYEAVVAIEKIGVPVRRCTSATVLAALGREHSFHEVEALLKRLWSRTLNVEHSSVNHEFDGADNQPGVGLEISDNIWQLRVPDVKMVVSSADTAVRAGRVDIAARLIRNMERNGIPSNVFAYSVLIKGYGRQKRLEGIRRTLSIMKIRQVVPDVALLNSAVDAFVRCEEWETARNFVLNDFKSYNIAPNEKSFNPILRGLAHIGDMTKALSVRSEMLAFGIQPDSVSLNALIHACVRANNFDRAMRLLRTAVPWSERDEYADSSLTGSETSEEELTNDQCVAYTTVISGLAESGEYKKSEKLLTEMSAFYKCFPNTRIERQVAIATTSMISALFKHGRTHDALALFKEMHVRYNARPVPDTYTAVIHGLCETVDRDSIDIASQIFEELQQTSQVLKSAEESGRREQGEDLDEEISKYYFFLKKMTIRTLKLAANIVINGFVRIDDMAAAES